MLNRLRTRLLVGLLLHGPKPKVSQEVKDCAVALCSAYWDYRQDNLPWWLEDVYGWVDSWPVDPAPVRGRLL